MFLAGLSVKTDQHSVILQSIEQSSIIQQRGFLRAKRVAGPDRLGRLAIAPQAHGVNLTLPPQLEKHHAVAVNGTDDYLAVKRALPFTVLPELFVLRRVEGGEAIFSRDQNIL